ncbi:hypothetical protein KBY93_03070 [Synechococcus sp. J7-Johnson]|uniref:hypothetical protein n=1 Tax=Synechococcus sp. J7-Johnson TaxID=2823737 RepID=UPI0020CE1426|nr:hypothetical protein [Synechococcus sp. J7-Johnson]MCP9839615.1 hypothetical protein [Synechococcus sp. J7-Johnson]
MDWPTAAELLQCPLADPAKDPDATAAELRWLGRFARVEVLRQRATILRAAPAWNARWALELAVALRLAGDPQAADALILEADRLEPTLALLPDPWGLWPAPTATGEEAPEARLARGLVQQLRGWRWLEASALEQSWIERARSTWQQGLDDEALDQLALLLHRSQAGGEAFQQLLIQLVGDAEMAAHPGAAAAFWGLVADARPEWDYAVLKAADLALQRGQLQRCAAWLHQPTGALAANPWCHDLSARLALADGRIGDALRHWGEAIARCSQDHGWDQPELIEIFRQRRREARRGTAVLHARSLLDRGHTAQARELLLQLVEQDPQWQPLRALLAQTERPSAAAESAGSANPTEPEARLSHFQAFLERIAAQRKLPLPALASASASASSVDTLQQGLDAFAAALADGEGRLALHS